MGKLTVRAIESAKPRNTPYKLMDGNGLQLRISTDGTKTWLVRYMLAGTEKQYRLPKPYRENSGEGFASLADAREYAAEVRSLARRGIDYQVQLVEANKAEARRLELERAKNKTVGDLFEAWLPTTDRKDKGAELRRMFRRDVLPFIGNVPVNTVIEEEMIDVVSAVVARGANRLAVMLLADMKQMFRWAEKQKAWRQLIEDNPVDAIKANKITSDDYDGKERTHTLSAANIRELWIKLPSAGLTKRTELACWIMLACCCRIGELVKARWEDIDLEGGAWKIPKENAKNKTAHTVFLSNFASAQFHRLREISLGSWCYPNASGDTHVCIKSTTKQIRDRQMSAMNRKPMKNRSGKADALILSNGDWVPHDLRRTGATMMQSLGVTPEVIERVLNHTEPNKLKRTYQTYDYAKEKLEAWRLLGERLALLTRNDAANVLPINNLKIA